MGMYGLHSFIYYPFAVNTASLYFPRVAGIKKYICSEGNNKAT